MKPVLEHVPSNSHQSLFIKRYEQSCFSFPWHYHPQWELTYIVEGSGIAYTDSEVRHYMPNEMVLTAPNVHHCWTSNSVNNSNVKSIYVQWDNNFLGDNWLDKAEFAAIKAMFTACRSGMLFLNSEELGAKLVALETMEPLKKLLGFVELLHDLSNHQDVTSIGQVTLTSMSSAADTRISAILEYVNSNFERKITADEMGALTNMTPVSFSKYFTRSFHKPFTQFLNEYRISQACSLLISSSLTVEQIAFRCGYQNMSFFHRQFKQIMQQTPLAFREIYQL
ncbi:AraC family transcriptional regulator [Vibrio hannami]|uniref:AraC family transcriptional regulator n=1 Tax=Vibrio hannami TaxID=2717094 RepID=UPI00241046A0|nr:AraC family transcriptional regulator [Vibrio hannami]MDG3086222.1 AraC family transcriptional regulator [Vibrio hannami]